MLKVEASPENISKEYDGTKEDIFIDLFVAAVSVLGDIFPSTEEYEMGKNWLIHMISNSTYDELPK